MITIKDVATEAGVAISTVSKVLNGVLTVRPDTRAAVEKAMERLNYIPNANARSLKGRRADVAGLFLSSIQGEFFSVLAQAIHLQCRMAGYQLNIYVSNDNVSEEIAGMMLSSGVSGAIVFNEGLTPGDARRIRDSGLPMVFIDREDADQGLSSVVIDSYAGVTLAMNYLIHQGHRRIGYMHGLQSYDDARRYQAYLDVLRANQLPINEDWILQGCFEEAVAYGEARKLFVRGTPLPDAIFCANDEMAWGAIRALRDSGVRVPDQVSVMGFDDIQRASHYNPALTTVRSPITELGNRSALELLRLINAPERAEGTITKLEPTLVTRDSCSLCLR